MQVICLEEEAFFGLIDQVVERLNEKHGRKEEKWIDEKTAMKLLLITSKTTLQKLRDEGEIRFSQPRRKPIAYDRDSINEYWEKHARETF